METFITNVVTPVANFVVDQVEVVANLILEMPMLGMVFGIFLLGAAVGIISRIIRAV